MSVCVRAPHVCEALFQIHAYVSYIVAHICAHCCELLVYGLRYISKYLSFVSNCGGKRANGKETVRDCTACELIELYKWSITWMVCKNHSYVVCTVCAITTGQSTQTHTNKNDEWTTHSSILPFVNSRENRTGILNSIRIVITTSTIEIPNMMLVLFINTHSKWNGDYAYR